MVPQASSLSFQDGSALFQDRHWVLFWENLWVIVLYLKKELIPHCIWFSIHSGLRLKDEGFSPLNFIFRTKETKLFCMWNHRPLISGQSEGCRPAWGRPSALGSEKRSGIQTGNLLWSGRLFWSFSLDEAYSKELSRMTFIFRAWVCLWENKWGFIVQLLLWFVTKGGGVFLFAQMGWKLWLLLEPPQEQNKASEESAWYIILDFL